MSTKIFWGDLLRQVRTSRGITQGEVASVLHISRQDYSNLETGRCHPAPEHLAILSNIYDVDLLQYVSDCMPVEFLEEQRAFKYNLATGAIQKERIEKKEERKRLSRIRMSQMSVYQSREKGKAEAKLVKAH